MINLGRLSIENFKSFEKKYEIDFRDTELFILDGPNGFGKTTVFDAVEICLTGDIGRIFSTDNKQKNSHLLKNSLDKPTNIFLELVTGQNTVLVIHASIPKSTSADDNKIVNCKANLKFLNKWPKNFEDLTTLNYINDVEIGEILNNKDIKETFNIFNYIQQEETLHYLKKKESERHNKISYLFGTSDEVAEKEHLNKIKNKLDNKKTELDSDICKLKKEVLNIEGDLKSIFNDNESNTIEPSGKIKKFTDNANLGFELKQHIDNISELIWLVCNPSDYKRIKLNYNINYILDNRNLELNNIIKIGHISKYDDFKKIERHIEWLNKLAILLLNHQNSLNDAGGVLTLDVINNLVKLHPKIALKHNFKIEKYRLLKSKIGTYQEIINNIVESRNSLKSHYEKHLVSSSEPTLCPFCGDVKSPSDKIWLEFKKHSEYFDALIDEGSKEINILLKDLKNNFVEECEESSKLFIKKYKKYSDYLQILIDQFSLKEQWIGMNKLKVWLQDSSIDLGGYIRSSIFEDVEDSLNLKYSNVVAYLRELILPMDLDKSYININSTIKLYGLVEENGLLLDEFDNVVEFSDLSLDLNFLNFLNFKSQSLILAEKNNKIMKLTKKHDAISTKLSLLKKIYSAYNTSIKYYELKVAKQIAIPFHVYSSKLLQTRPDGNGAYLQSAANASENGYIRFVSNFTDDHDALNTMSSGQLSGIILSFTLAMNKVYPSNFNTLLIDDPVQTMDEINLASFVQLLRNEFSDYQLVIATHERKTSSYFSYKYQLDNIVRVLNLKNERLNR
ncbi:AAA family ATPase [Acinetobacter bereziniae]|uniref:AAA family ATPase n=1 Tax=Acinetobacter bereziniae TaxID=106648 RepID=UPI0028130514|nr:AAA family ATPase [Acinetobacter bereziniae]MDQ9821118.1 AAA family ATPase [Acinetobacter bereziniae]